MSERDFSSPDAFPEEHSRQECETIRQYLAVWNDLTTEQRRVVAAHVRSCPSCSTEHLAMNQVTQLIASLEESSPSARVDQAVMTAIEARVQHGKVSTILSPYRQKRRRNVLRTASLLVVAAAVVLAMFATVHFMNKPSATQAFLLPATLTWSGYVLYHTQTKQDSKGKNYRVTCYNDIEHDYLNVETVQQNSVDVIKIQRGPNNLVMDRMHHIAQENVQGWGVDMSEESLFNLNEVRHELATHQASYLDTDTFRGIAVYRIRSADGLVLLLDMSYRPVNILVGAEGPGTGEPVYDTVSLISQALVPSSMWSMSVPQGYKMGVLPAQL